MVTQFVFFGSEESVARVKVVIFHIQPSHPPADIKISAFFGHIADLVMKRVFSADIKKPVKMISAFLFIQIRMPSLF